MFLKKQNCNFDAIVSSILVEQNNVNSIDDLYCFPNPSSSNVTLDFHLTHDENLSISVLNAIGKEVYKIDNRIYKSGLNQLTLSLSHLRQGLYFIEYTPRAEGTYIFHMVAFSQGTQSHGSAATLVLGQDIAGISRQVATLNDVLITASDELGVWLVILAAELDARPSGVVQELIVTHPQGSVPGFVVCPTVVGCVGSHGAGHVFVSLILV